MKIIDIPIYTRQDGISRLSSVSSSNLSSYKFSIVNPDDQMYLIKTFSFGSIILSSDIRIMNGPLIKNAQLKDSISICPDLQFYNSKIPAKLMRRLEEERRSDTINYKLPEEVYPYLSKLEKLDEKETKVAFKYLKAIFKYGTNENLIWIKGKCHEVLARTLQLLGWKLGVHSEYNYSNGGSSLLFKDDCSYTIIDYERNKVHSLIKEMKLIYKYSPYTKFYSLTSDDLPVIPTVAGTFSF